MPRSDIKAAYARLERQLGEGDFDAMIATASEALIADDAVAAVYYMRGFAYLRKDLPDHAIEDFNSALAIDPASADAYRFRGLAYKAKGQFDRAFSDDEKANELEATKGEPARTAERPVAGSLPKIMNLAYDRSCNLACPYCRVALYNPRKQVNHTEQIHTNLFAGGLPGVDRLVIAGNGDVCASRYYMDFLENFDAARYPGLRIKIQTNGLLFTRERWARIARAHGAIDWISVSVDAATPDTYRKNRGGDFNKLLECLEFVGGLRRSHQIKLFFINFVVQANNFREMKSFIDLGEKYNCDLVDFQAFEDWGTYTPAQFAAAAIQKPSHPEHQEFLAYLDDPKFANPIVSIYKLLDFMPEYIRKWIGQEDVISYHTVGEAIGQRGVPLRQAEV